MSKPTEREQKLVDIMFSIGLTIHDDKWFKGKSREEVAEWIADKLRGCGFYTTPVGMSWGVLLESKIEYEDLVRLMEDLEDD